MLDVVSQWWWGGGWWMRKQVSESQGQGKGSRRESRRLTGGLSQSPTSSSSRSSTTATTQPEGWQGSARPLATGCRRAASGAPLSSQTRGRVAQGSPCRRLGMLTAPQQGALRSEKTPGAVARTAASRLRWQRTPGAATQPEGWQGGAGRHKSGRHRTAPVPHRGAGTEAQRLASTSPAPPARGEQSRL